MSQVNRCIEDNPDLDDVDHALGRPYRPFDTYRSHYATSCPEQIAKFRASPWWDRGKRIGSLTFFHVSDAGRQALADELAKVEKYGRLFEITSSRYEGRTLVMAKSHSQAKYHAYINADLDWTFFEYCQEIRARLAA